MSKTKKNLSIMIAFLFTLAFLFGIFIRIVKLGYLVSGFIYYFGLLAMLLYMVIILEKKSLASIGFDFQNIVQKIFLGIGIFAFLEIVFTSYYYFVYGIKPYFVHLSFTQTLLQTIYFIFLLGLTEELIFRGYIFERINEIFNSQVISVLLSSVLFALWHFPVKYYLGQVVFAFFFGIILSTIRAKAKGNIIVSLAIAHGLYNAFIYLGGYFLK